MARSTASAALTQMHCMSLVKNRAVSHYEVVWVWTSRAELIYWDSRCSALFVDKPTFFRQLPDFAQELQLKVFTEAR
jgi:hypothetical protein